MPKIKPSIETLLAGAQDFQKIIVNAERYSDLEPFCQALAGAIAKGKNYLFRSVASVVKVLGGVPDQPLLSRENMAVSSGSAGLIVVGSHTQKSTSQLNALLSLPCIEAIPFQSDLVLETEEVFRAEITRARKACEKAMKDGKTAVVYTNRTLLVQEGDTQESALLRSVRISDGLQTIVKELKGAPSFIIAKGGITSSDVATKALAVRCAFVLGQVKPGIPVWRTGEESLFPNVPYVIFPGNVGNEDSPLFAGKKVSSTNRAAPSAYLFFNGMRGIACLFHAFTVPEFDVFIITNNGTVYNYKTEREIYHKSIIV